MAAADDSIAKDALPLFLSFPHPISRPVLLWPTCGFRVSQSLQTLLSCSFCSWRSCVRASATVPPMIATRRGLGWSGVEAARAESGANEEKRRADRRQRESSLDRAMRLLAYAGPRQWRSPFPAAAHEKSSMLWHKPPTHTRSRSLDRSFSLWSEQARSKAEARVTMNGCIYRERERYVYICIDSARIHPIALRTRQARDESVHLPVHWTHDFDGEGQGRTRDDKTRQARLCCDLRPALSQGGGGGDDTNTNTNTNTNASNNSPPPPPHSWSPSRQRRFGFRDVA